MCIQFECWVQTVILHNILQHTVYSEWDCTLVTTNFHQWLSDVFPINQSPVELSDYTHRVYSAFKLYVRLCSVVCRMSVTITPSATHLKLSVYVSYRYYNNMMFP